jgi:hypothetical protein
MAIGLIPRDDCINRYDISCPVVLMCFEIKHRLHYCLQGAQSICIIKTGRPVDTVNTSYLLWGT